MTRTILDDLFEDLLGLGRDVLGGLQDKVKVPAATATPANDDTLIEALGRCRAEYRIPLTLLVEQTALHAKQESNNQRFVRAYVGAAIFVDRSDLARELLDAIVNPDLGQMELRGLFHYEAGNSPLACDLLARLDGRYGLGLSRYAHASSLHDCAESGVERYKRILVGLEDTAAPAAAMLGVVQFNNGNWAEAARYFEQALALKPTDRSMLNYMCARAKQTGSGQAVVQKYAPVLYGELGYTGSLADMERELSRSHIQFPRLKLRMNREVSERLLG